MARKRSTVPNKRKRTINTPAVARQLRDKVLVTGACGYTAGFVLPLLCDRGFDVVATVRSHDEAQFFFRSPFYNTHQGRITVYVIPDITLDGAYDFAVRGVVGVIHTAVIPSGVSTPVDEGGLSERARQGVDRLVEAVLRNNLNGGKRCASIVMVSSLGAVRDLGTGPRPGYTYTPEDWNPVDDAMAAAFADLHITVSDTATRMADGVLNPIVALARKTAEEQLRRKASENACSFAATTVCASMLLGPTAGTVWAMKDLRTSPGMFYGLMNGSLNNVPPTSEFFAVDVRDYAIALVTAMQKHQNMGERTRYILAGSPFSYQSACDTIRTCSGDLGHRVPLGSPGTTVAHYNVSDSKVQNLGVIYRPLVETIMDTFDDLIRHEGALRRCSAPSVPVANRGPNTFMPAPFTNQPDMDQFGWGMPGPNVVAPGLSFQQQPLNMPTGPHQAWSGTPGGMVPNIASNGPVSYPHYANGNMLAGPNIPPTSHLTFDMSYQNPGAEKHHGSIATGGNSRMGSSGTNNGSFVGLDPPQSQPQPVPLPVQFDGYMVSNGTNDGSFAGLGPAQSQPQPMPLPMQSDGGMLTEDANNVAMAPPAQGMGGFHDGNWAGASMSSVPEFSVPHDRDAALTAPDNHVDIASRSHSDGRHDIPTLDLGAEMPIIGAPHVDDPVAPLRGSVDPDIGNSGPTPDVSQVTPTSISHGASGDMGSSSDPHIANDIPAPNASSADSTFDFPDASEFEAWATGLSPDIGNAAPARDLSQATPTSNSPGVSGNMAPSAGSNVDNDNSVPAPDAGSADQTFDFPGASEFEAWAAGPAPDIGNGAPAPDASQATPTSNSPGASGDMAPSAGPNVDNGNGDPAPNTDPAISPLELPHNLDYAAWTAGLEPDNGNGAPFLDVSGAWGDSNIRLSRERWFQP